jgi:hypothetical protein
MVSLGLRVHYQKDLLNWVEVWRVRWKIDLHHISWRFDHRGVQLCCPSW